MNRQTRLLLAVALLALAAGVGTAIWHQQPSNQQPGAAEALLHASLPDLQNQFQTLAHYRGKVLVVGVGADAIASAGDDKTVRLWAASTGKAGSKTVSTIGARNREAESEAQAADEPLKQLMLRLANEFELVRAVRFAHGSPPDSH